MNYIKDTLEYLTKIFQWWVIVMPWEKAIRVRLGKQIKILSEGTHFRIPFIDAIYLQSIRLRVIEMSPQTIMTKDRQTLTVVCCAGYTITDILKLYQKMYQPETTISNIIMAEIATHIASNNLSECRPEDIQEKVFEKLKSEDFGIEYTYVKITGYAIVRAFRLIQDSHWTSNSLSTTDKL